MLYPKDSDVKVERHEGAMKLEWRWKSEDKAPMTLVAIMMSVAAIIVVVLPEKPGQEMSQGGRLFFYIFMALALPSMYSYVLSCYLNRTKAHCERERITVQTWPFPWFKTFEIPAKGIKQFFVTLSRSNSRKHWTLYFLDADSNYRELGKYFTSEIAAFQVCHELQDFYCLEDLPVYGQNTQPHQPGPRAR
ncbi:MAG: hypothetical protein WCG75_03090 [Armatimonadota bacterium]